MAQLNTVIVHPLVLLSIVDHYNREAKDNKDKRVVGVLLGTTFLLTVIYQLLVLNRNNLIRWICLYYEKKFLIMIDSCIIL